MCECCISCSSVMQAMVESYFSSRADVVRVLFRRCGSVWMGWKKKGGHMGNENR